MAVSSFDRFLPNNDHAAGPKIEREFSGFVDLAQKSSHRSLLELQLIPGNRDDLWLRARWGIGRKNLQLENCSSGGGRTDLGMNSRFTTAWISDWMRMPRTIRILNGMSMALPAEYLNRLFGVCMQGSYRGNPEAQLHAIMFGHPAISGITPSLAEANPDLLALTKKYVYLYKSFIRPWHRDARLYHHTPKRYLYH